MKETFIEKKAINELLQAGEKNGNYTSGPQGYTGYKPHTL